MSSDPNYLPLFVRTPFIKGQQFGGTANTGRDGSGNIVTVIEPGEHGCRVDWIGFKATVTTTAGIIRVYLYNSRITNGWACIGEVNNIAYTPSGTQQSWSGVWVPLGGYMTLAPGQLVGVSSHNAETCIAIPEGGHF